MDDRIDDLYRAMDASRETASNELLEDALRELTTMAGDPDNRLRLLALVALDDMQAASVNEDEKERLAIAKGGLQSTLYSRIPVVRDSIYETTFAIVEDALAEDQELPVYHALLPVHQRMVEEEEAEHQAELRAIEEAEERAFNEEVAAALRASEELVAEQARLAEQARQQPIDPAARRALVLQAIERRKAQVQHQHGPNT